jgi:hypothetical protein
MFDPSFRMMEDEKTRSVPLVGRMLGDIFFGQMVVIRLKVEILLHADSVLR